MPGTPRTRPDRCADGAPPAPRWNARQRDRIYWYLRYLGCTPELSEDLVQDTLHAGCRSDDALTLDDRAADAWLRTTARNLYFMHLRREQRRREVQDTEMVERVWHEDVENDSRQAALRECLNALGGRSQRALELHYVEHKSRADIARELGIGENGVKSLLRRLRQSLKECTERRLR